MLPSPWRIMSHLAALRSDVHSQIGSRWLTLARVGSGHPVAIMVGAGRRAGDLGPGPALGPGPPLGDAGDEGTPTLYALVITIWE